MELNFAVSSARITTCREQPPSVERVQLRETRSSYFLNIQLQGLRKEDIQLEMDKDRCLVIRGEKYSQEMGMLRWKWRVVESGTPSKPFKIPEDVNVGGIRVSFDKGLLHISMPKLNHNTFSPYHVFHIHSSHLPHRPHQPSIKEEEEEANNKASISEDGDKMEPLSPGHSIVQEEEAARECSTVAPSNSVESVDDSINKEACVSQSQSQQERIGKGTEGEESSTKITGVADAEAKQGALLQGDGEKVKKGYYEKVKEEGRIDNGHVESTIPEHPKPFLCGCLSQIFSAIAAIAHRKRRCQ